MKFAMMINGDHDEWAKTSPEEGEQGMKEVYAWFERWQATGKIADGGAELQLKDTAKTVRRNADGETVITDGPYLELKEVIGGVVFLECDDIEEAVSIAATWPLGSSASNSIEVRPVRVR